MSANLHDAYQAARTHSALFDVSARGKIEATGNEAVVFLHNLCTNDIKTLSPGTGCEAFFCTATAKVVAHGWLWRYPPEGKRETIWIDLDPGLNEKLYQHLDRYLISEDVTLTDHTQQLAQFHLAGPNAVQVLASAGIDFPQWQLGTFQTRESVTVRCINLLGLPGFDLLCPVTEGKSLAARVTAAGASPVGEDVYEVLRIEAGTPVFGKDIDDNTFAPEVGRTAAISYNKGCYLGQEPIVMARDRGVVQRTLVGLLVGESPVPAGTLLYRDGKEVGRATSSVRSPRRGEAVALGYVRRGHQQPGTELEADVEGTRRKVRVVELPLV